MQDNLKSSYWEEVHGYTPYGLLPGLVQLISGIMHWTRSSATRSSAGH